MKGKFITLESIDGAGKTTMVDLAVDYLKKSGINVIRTREPGGTDLGLKIREILLGDNSDMCVESELLLMFAARAQHIEEIILPAITSGVWVISDRFTDSTYAYQGAGREVSLRKIEMLDSWATGMFRPDLTLYLDIDVETGNKRSSRSGENKDRFEIQKNEFKERVRNYFVDLVVNEPDRVKGIDASRSIDGVSRQIFDELDYLIEVDHFIKENS